MGRTGWIPRAAGVFAVVLAAMFSSGLASAQGKKPDRELHVIGVYQVKGEAPESVPYYEDGAQLAVKDLEKQGWDVTYERIPASSLLASSHEQALLAAEAKDPDAMIALTSSGVFVPLGAKVATTGIPTFALSSPTEGVRGGPAGGDNIFLLRPLNEQVYSKALEYACTKLHWKRIGLNLINTSFGSTVQNVVNRELPRYKGCQVVTTQTNAANTSDMTQQVLAYKEANVDGIISANFPNPVSVLINQLRQNGVNVPFMGGASLNIAKDSNTITTGLDGLYVIDDACVPDLGATKAQKKFTKQYQAAYGYVPSYISAQTYDALHMAADAIERAGSHDHAKVNKAMLATDYSGACQWKPDKNNVMSSAATVYKYGSDGSKKLVTTLPLEFIPPAELATATTTTSPPTAR